MKHAKPLRIGALIIGLVVTVPLLAAFEAHVVNVTAQIESGAIVVNPLELDYGTVFPQEALDEQFSVALSDTFLEETGPGDNLLVNGGFETPIVTDPQLWDIFPDGTAGLGWSVRWEPGQPTTFNSQPRPDPARLELHRSVAGWLPYEGAQHTELDTDWDGPNGSLTGEPALVNIYQDIPTELGKTYRLTYAFSPRPGTDASQNILKVRIDGTEIDSHSGAGGGNTNWTVFTNDIVAAGATTRVEFAASGTPDSLGVFLDDVQFFALGRIGEISYVVRQKPKCVDAQGEHPQVTEENGEFVCPDGSTMMPLLCPYLSKHELTGDPEQQENDSPGINAFHGLPGPWNLATTLATQVTGALSEPQGDLGDQWNVDLRVPCFRGACAQDWPDFVRTESGNPDIDPEVYKADPALEHEVYGCDLWVEVTSLN